MARKKSKADRERIQQLIEEATVDCYGEDEQWMGVLTSVAENITCPFTAKVLGETVQVTELKEAPSGRSVLAVCQYKGKPYEIDLNSLEWGKDKPEGYEWVEVYKAWLEMDY